MNKETVRKVGYQAVADYIQKGDMKAAEAVIKVFKNMTPLLDMSDSTREHRELREAIADLKELIKKGLVVRLEQPDQD